ncbi:cilia- and flagella-associated protein 157 [Colossoma macropomum]|uniref:cilia- and flagella-associated protein 157 n=1 Tax=Colossoma macropomum TaxID=42526 RepID=UPI001864F951|nr:cilia- and flagella-associated protein 157 [Colossoma macropomum]
MPPKKNGKKNADKSTKKEGEGSGEKPDADDVLSEGSKEFYRAQIRDLEERIEKYQHKCDELEVREKDFSTNYNNVEREKKDIVLYLKRSLAHKEDELTDLSEKLLALQIAKDEEKESFEMQLSALRHEFQENKDKLVSENMALAGKLASLEEFRVQKDEIMALLASLKEQLEQQKQEHQTIIYNLERKAVLDNDRLKKEMQQHVATVAAEFRRVSDRRMPETTMRAIHENVSVTAQLRQLSDKSKELLVENDSLKAKEKQLSRETEIMESLLNEMTMKSVGNQKVVQQLTEKCKQMHTELENFARHKQEHQQLLDDHTALQKEHDDLRQTHESHMGTLKRKQAEAERLKKELEKEKMQREQLETVQQEAAVALKEALREVPKEEDSNVQAVVRRSQLMQKLLAMLDNAAAIGKGPVLSDFIPITDHTDEPTTGQGMERPGLRAPGQKTTSRLSHFKTGDLGLVPRQINMRSSVLSKIGPLSKSTQLHLQRKLQSQKRNNPPKPLAEDDTCTLQPEPFSSSPTASLR